MTVTFCAGLASAWLWRDSTARWHMYLDRAEMAGLVLFHALQSGSPPPAGATVTPLSESQTAMAERGAFERLSSTSKPVLVTNLSILADADPLLERDLTIAILSPDLRYPLADLVLDEIHTSEETFGALTRVLATYCSTPDMIIGSGDASWVKVEAPTLWGCTSTPPDLRLLAVLFAGLALAGTTTVVLNLTGSFARFADALGSRHRSGGPKNYDVEGPVELRAIVDAVNRYLAVERDRLAKRAAVLSGVSHDLGTPATRLRLRTALISDADLRAKLEADIDKMTGIIESVLDYTRVELDAEEPRRISLNSLIESIVDDYQDTGSPVTLGPAQKITVTGGHSLFMSRRGIATLNEDRQILVTARPIALGRAVSNLVDNALKYGRRAQVGLEATSQSVSITVEDEGTEVSAQQIENMMSPFQRGMNAMGTEGHGLGLTIVAAIADLHGGELSYEPGATGLRARLRISR